MRSNLCFSVRSTLFFSVVPAYVLLFKDKDCDWCIDAARTEFGRAITYFLSPIDAVIEAAHLEKRGQLCRIVAASELKQSLFRDVDGRGLIGDMHLGWPALDGHILARPGGDFGRCCRVMHHWAVESVGFEEDEIVLAEYSRLRELTGLYAWQETAAHFPGWTGTRRGTIAERAVESIELLHGEPKDCSELALFDPEFEQWHFVRYTGTT